jgi:hypothetical protein
VLHKIPITIFGTGAVVQCMSINNINNKMYVSSETALNLQTPISYSTTIEL